MSKLSVSQAVAIYRVSQATLYRDLKSGKVSFERNGKNKRVIDPAELERVYGKASSSNTSDEASLINETHEDDTQNSQFSPKGESERENEKDKLIDLLEKQLEHERAEKSKLLDMLSVEQEKTRLLMLPAPKKKRRWIPDIFRKK